ncbi:unnamed protein product, partial [Meganyctiphanes norvegica]
MFEWIGNKMFVISFVILLLNLAAAEQDCNPQTNEDASIILSFKDQEQHLIKGNNFTLHLNIDLKNNDTVFECFNVTFISDHPDIGDVLPWLQLCPDDEGPVEVTGTLKNEGKTIVKLCLEGNNTDI